ncbi:MAG: hypothetical protein DRP57_07095 [Spirochaetes bacterium]|nr:MAG: hypothetical protein DRP57_07095 [Spirochaetota bacterium]
MNIVWDFDGTILPLTPYDSEQSLLNYIIKKKYSGKNPFKFALRRFIIRGIIYADMKNLIGHRFKSFYLWAVKGTKKEVLDNISQELALRISLEDIQTYRQLHAAGHTQILISCGTEDLSRKTLAIAGINRFFSAIIANRFIFEKGVISEFEYRTLKPEDKLKKVISIGFLPSNTVVVGDGPTDIPLLNWSGFPIVLNRKGERDTLKLCKKYTTIRQPKELINYIESVEN